MQTIAQAGEAQAALQTHTDPKTHQEIVATLPGTDLDNFFGMAMHLPPKMPPKDETAQQAAQRGTGHRARPVLVL